MQQVGKQTASKVGHRMDRGSEKADGDEGQIVEVPQCLRWDPCGLVLPSTRGHIKHIAQCSSQKSRACYQLPKKAGKKCEGTKRAIRAVGLITETQKYPFGKLALFAPNRFQQPI